MILTRKESKYYTHTHTFSIETITEYFPLDSRLLYQSKMFTSTRKSLYRFTTRYFSHNQSRNDDPSPQRGSLNNRWRRAVHPRRDWKEGEWKIGPLSRGRGAQVQNWRTIPAATQGSGGRRRQTGGGGAGSGQEGANDGNRGRERGRVRSWWHQLPASRDTLRSISYL